MEVCSGVLGAVDAKDGGEGGVESVVRFARQIFLGNTRDGGMGVWVEGPRWRGWPDSEVFEVPGVGEGGVVVEGGGGEKREKREERRLQGYCHCRGVEFYVTPPDEEEDDEHAESASGAEKKVFSSPFSFSCSFIFYPLPNLIWTSPFPSSSSHIFRNSLTLTQDSQWYLRASGTKYLAGLCACNSCRLATGHDLQAWAFIPHSHIHHPQDGSIFNLRPEGSEGKGNTTTTLKTYSHTPGAKRGFCGRCGATVFWSHEERRGDVIDISVGLLEEEGGGARAEGWLEWRTEGVSFAECALNKELVGMVVEGLGKWGEGRGKVGGQGG